MRSNSQKRRIATQVLLLLVMSAVLGFGFNSSNPIGIRFVAETENDQPVIDVKPLPQNLNVPLLGTPEQLGPQIGSTDFTPKTASTPGKIVHVSWREVKRHLSSDQILLVDARPKIGYEHGHIPGAVNLPYSPNPQFAATPEDYEAFQKQYPKDTPIAVYCSTHTCQLSQIVAEKLVNEYGFTNVRKMDDGWLEYTEAELRTNSTEKASTPLEPFVKDATAAARVKPAEWIRVKTLVAESKAVLVDARPRVNYDHGHIPGAVSLPYSPEPKAAATPADFEAFQKAYPKETPVVVYCASRTCQLSQIMAEKLVELGYRDVSKMNQGWLEYSEIEHDSVGESLPHTFGERRVVGTDSSSFSGEPNIPVTRSIPPVDPARQGVTSSLNPSRTTWSEVKPLLASGAILLVDVRQEHPYTLGHIPGAINLPYVFKEKDFEPFLRKYPKDMHIVTYCTDAGCPLSTKMAEVLVKKFGYRHVQHMTEGYAEWQRFNTLEAKASK